MLNILMLIFGVITTTIGVMQAFHSALLGLATLIGLVIWIFCSKQL